MRINITINKTDIRIKREGSLKKGGEIRVNKGKGETIRNQGIDKAFNRTVEEI